MLALLENLSPLPEVNVQAGTETEAFSAAAS